MTASDVQSCLYYVHVDNVEDERIRESLELEENQLERKDHHGTAHMKDGFWREAANRGTSSTHQDCSEFPSRVTPYFQAPTDSLKTGILPARKPVGSGVGIRPRSMDIPSNHSMQNLIGPRPMHQRLRSESSMASGTNSEHSNPNMKRGLEQRLAGAKQGYYDRRIDEPFEGSPQQQGANSSGSIHEYQRNSQDTAQSTQPGFDQDTSLTLIRRYDGMQWNVAKISTTSYVTSPDEPHQAQSGISITIANPGYSKFTDPAVSVVEGLGRHEKATCLFKRQLWKPSDRKRPELGEKSASQGSSLSMHGLKTKLKIRKDIRQDINEENVGENTGPSKGFVFHSPWGGICELSTGIVGRSLKCKHTMNSFGSISKADLPSIPVSELRFNLPSSRSPSGSSHDSSATSRKIKEPKRSSFLPTKHQRQASSIEMNGDSNHEDATYYDEKMDLSLGQEHAGGGFGGKQAKLGKLIIEKEGTKMLDLVVAANIALWWRAYVKNIGSTSQ